MEVGSKLHTLAVLHPEKKAPVPIVSETRWIPEPVWKFWRGKNKFYM
jgi:hypothetical protein